MIVDFQKIQETNIGNNAPNNKYSTFQKDIMVRERIIQTAFEQFSQYGIKSISMDMIARLIGISKRTIYGYFNDKEELLTEGIGFYSAKVRQLSDIVYKESSSVLEAIILFHKKRMQNPRWYTSRFYNDLHKFPKAIKRLEEEKTNFANECLLLFMRGVQEGVFRKDINFEIISFLAKDQIEMQRPEKKYPGHSLAEIYTTMLLIFLRGICTEKGRAIMDTQAQAILINDKQL